jgi:hypothetical protein
VISGKSVVGPLAVSVALVAGVGAVHGISTDRWGPSGQLQQAVGALDRVPPVFGDWVGEDVAYEPEDMARAGIKRCVFRRYKNDKTREVVSVLLVCGRGGPISVHTPDVCYAGAGYQQVSAQARKEVTDADGKHAFWAARFASPGGLSKNQLDVYWAWSDDGRAWDAPENPRMAHARSPALYKLYVVREFMPSAQREVAEDACRAFLTRALPEIRERLTAQDRAGQ